MGAVGYDWKNHGFAGPGKVRRAAKKEQVEILTEIKSVLVIKRHKTRLSTRLKSFLVDEK